MSQALTYVPERLDHLGIEAFVCQEIGLAAYLDALDTSYHARVSVGTATVAMILNGQGFSNRRLYLVPQFFADKPVETLLGPGITADDLNDECLGRTLEWLYAHDPTVLFAGIATQARRVFGITARQIHVDTTSFSVSGEYLPEEGDLDASIIAITYGYSRDHRADLKQWMLALGTTQDGDIPLFLRPLDGTSSDQRTLLSAVQALAEQLRTRSGRRGADLHRRQWRLQQRQYGAVECSRHPVGKPCPGNVDGGESRPGPDTKGRFPWQDGFEERFRDKQPLLF